jgi:hypothetical protein
MPKQLLFACVTLGVLVLALLGPAKQVQAYTCNNKVCTDVGGGSVYCMSAQSPPSTQCADGPGHCSWDWCTPQ